MNPKTWAIVAATSGTIYMAQHFASTPFPKKRAVKRALEVSAAFFADIKKMYTFDQLCSGFELEEVREDGYVRGSITAAGPLMSKDGMLHEGALMCLIDDVTSLSVLLKHSWPGVTVEMNFASFVPVLAGDVVLVESRLLRIGNTLAFTSCELRRAGELVAVGGQTKHVGLPFMQRVVLGLGGHFSMIGSCKEKSYKEWRDGTIKKYVYPLEHIKPESTMEVVLGLQRQDKPTTYRANMSVQLLNGFLSGHGAASAALMAASVRELMSSEKNSQKARIFEMHCSYLTPVPAFKPANIVVDASPVTAGSARHFVTEICNDKGQQLVCGTVTTVAT